MAMASISHVTMAGGCSAVRRVIALCSALRAAMRRRRRRRAELDLLSQISPHLLADIGLRRSDLDAIMAGVVPVEQIGPHAPARWPSALVVLPGGRGSQDRGEDFDAAA